MLMLPVVIVSDFSSPFCWLAEAALRRLEQEGAVRIGYHACELFPTPTLLPPPPEVEAGMELAREIGIQMRPPSRAVRTRKAHELARTAAGLEHEGALRDAIFGAYLRDDRDIGRIDVLVAVARETGLDHSEAGVVLGIDTHAAAVQAETVRARQSGIDALPVVFLGGGDAVMRVDGAFPLQEWRRMVDQATRSTQTES
jgi:predicted DsbA family dithiol-disulfide isomerase